jgi:hypothetical protein
MADEPKRTVDKLREELEEKELKKQLENLDKEPELHKMRNTATKSDHHITFYTTVAMEKTIASKIMGHPIPINEGDWTLPAAVLTVEVKGDETRDETGRLPDIQSRYHM